MKLKSLVAAAAALSLSSAPAIAAPAAPTAAPAPAAETVEGSEFYRTGILIPIAAVVALALIVYLIVDSTSDDDPASP